MSEAWRCKRCGHAWAYLGDEDEPGIDENEEETITLIAVPFFADHCEKCRPDLPQRPRS